MPLHVVFLEIQVANNTEIRGLILPAQIWPAVAEKLRRDLASEICFQCFAAAHVRYVSKQERLGYVERNNHSYLQIYLLAIHMIHENWR
jgi:hypothetical protein